MPYNSVVDSFHTKKLCSRLSASSLQAKCDFTPKTAIVRF